MTRRVLGAPLRRQLLRAVAVAAAAVVLLTGAVAPASADHREPSLRVMTRNLYLGADLTPALDPTLDTPGLPGCGGLDLRREAGDRLRRPGRGDRRRDRPHRARPGRPAGGLRMADQRAGDCRPEPGLPGRAQAALAARGLDYAVASVSENAVIGPVPLVAPCASTTVGACQLTFTDRDVILVNRIDPAAALEQSAVRHLRRPTGLHPAAARGAGAVVPPRLGLDRREVPRPPVPLRHHPPGDLGLCQDPAGAGRGVPGRSGLRAGGRPGGRRLQLRRRWQLDPDLRAADRSAAGRLVGPRPGAGLHLLPGADADRPETSVRRSAST